MRRLAVVGPLAVVIVSFVTATIVTLGPKPHRVAAHPHLLPIEKILIEPADRLVLLCWWLTPLIICGALWAARRGKARDGLVLATGVVVSVTAVALAVLQILGDVDRAHLYPGIDAGALLAGVALTLVVLMMWGSSARLARIATALVLVPLAATALIAAFQTPDGVVDADSFRYTADELAAPATGQWPLAGFSPQYSTLLGWPIAPVLRAWPDHALWVILLWLLALQALTVVLAVRLPVRAGGWRMLAPSALVVVLPLVGTTASGLNGSTYFANLPMRLVLPLVTISVAYEVLRVPRPTGTRRLTMGLLLVGALCGLTVLNNADFGVPLVVAVLVSVAIAATRGSRLRHLALVAAASVVVPIGYWLAGTVTGHTVDWASVLLFPTLFGAEGYFSVAMAPLGLHVVVAALFAAATTVGLLLLRHPAAARGSAPRRQGLLLLTVGLWSLLSLAYFSGRSYTSTLMGSALQAGIVVAGFLPLVRAGLRRWRACPAPQRGWTAGGIVLGLLAMSACMASVALVYPPTTYVATQLAGRPGPGASLDRQAQSVLAAIGREGTPQSGARTDGTLAQWLDRPALTTLLTGIPSGLVVNSPEYFTLSTRISRMQCDRLRQSSASVVLVEPRILAALLEEPSCTELLDAGRAVPLDTEPPVVAVPVG